MRALHIDGHPLPERLSRLIGRGRWKAIADRHLLEEVTGADYPDLLQFLSPQGMSLNLEGLREIVSRDQEGEAEADYGMASSRARGAHVALPLLDVDAAVPIMIALSEFMVCLDYRDDPSSPRVVAPDLRASPGAFRWHVIAPSFDDLAGRLGLAG